MINKIHFHSYKNLVNLDIELISGINIIAGNNGTCKSSILHVISNSYKKTTSTSPALSNNKCISIITKLNKYTVPKIESLNKGSAQTNDPSNGHKGSMYDVYFDNGGVQSFRKHNSKLNNRYAVKPYYERGKAEKLSESMNIYLSLDRLYPYGEFQDDGALSKLSANLPTKYLNEIATRYKEFTNIDISYSAAEQMGDIKNRWKFTTQNEHIDSNTISSGEDNLLIILIATYSLMFYCDSLNKPTSQVYLLVDEYDASLHPEFQVKFLSFFDSLHEEYPNLSMVVTTHSLTTIEESINKNYNLIYLTKRPSGIKKMESPDMKKIKANLLSSLNRDLYTTVKIPVLTEDAEAKLLLETLMEHFQNDEESDFCNVRRYFNLIDASFSCETIKTLCSSRNIPKNNFPAIAVLDGDQEHSLQKSHLNDCIIALPGSVSPEKLIYAICKSLENNTSKEADLFWDVVEPEYGFSHDVMIKEIIPKYEAIDKQIKDLKDKKIPTKGIYREKSKKIFRQYEHIFKKLFEFWINQNENESAVNKFYSYFKTTYYKIADYYSLSNDLWRK